MSGLHLVTGWGLIGVIKENTVDRYLPWYAEAATDMGLGYLAAQRGFTFLGMTFRNPANVAARALGRSAHRATGALARVTYQRLAVPTATRMAAASGTMALYGSAVAAGYAIGAVVGTGISHALFGKAGARDAMEFYSGQVSFDQYFATVGEALGTL